MRVKSLVIRDILSIKEADISFEDNGLVLLEGWNYDDNKSNGAGKTAIFNALAFVLYGNLPRKISMTEIVRDGCKKGYVEASIEIDGAVYSVKRERPSNLIIIKDGVVQTINQQQLEALYQLNYEQFLVSMYSAQNEGEKFIRLNDSDKKDFLLRLMDLQSFSDAKKHVDLQLKQLLLDKTLKERELASVNSKIEAYKDSEINVEDLKVKITTLEKNVDDARKAIIAMQTIQRPDDSDFLSRENAVYKQLETIAAIKVKRAGHLSTYNSLEKQIMNASVKYDAVICPHCSGIVNENHKHDTSELQSQSDMELANIQKCDTIIAKEQSVKNKLTEIKTEKTEAFKQYDRASSRISELKSFIASAGLDRLKTRLQEAESIGTKIATLEQSRNKLILEMRDIGKTMDLKETLSHMYGPTGAPAYIMDSIVDGFNTAVSKYVDMAWGSATYALKTYKENAKGDITTKFSETLTINGETKSVGSRSGGEQKLLSLCIDFAVIDVLSNNFNIQLNPIILDEPFDHLDAVTRELMMDMLEEISLDKQIWVVDHTTEFKAKFTKTLKVEKRSGISSIVIE